MKLLRAFEHANAVQQVPSGEVEGEEGRLLGREGSEEIVVAAADVGVVGDVHVFTA